MELALQLEAATRSARRGAGGEELVVQPLYTIADTEMTAVINLGGGDDTLQYAHNALTAVMAALPGCMSVNTNLHETDIQDFEHLSILLQQPSVQQISGAFAELSCLMSRLEGPRVAELSAMKVPVQALGLSAGAVLKRKRSARYALAIGIIRFFQENEIPGFSFRMNSNMAWYVLQCRFADQPMWQHAIEDDHDAIPTNVIEDQEELSQQDEEHTKKSDSEGTQKEPKTAKKQDEEVLCCSYETCALVDKRACAGKMPQPSAGSAGTSHALTGASCGGTGWVSCVAAAWEPNLTALMGSVKVQTRF